MKSIFLYSQALVSSGNRKIVSKNGKIEYNEMDILGNGTYSSVYRGTFFEERKMKRDVAVKRVYESQIENDILEKMSKLEPHPNIIQCFYYETDTYR